MREMKDSGIEWVGAIPVEWKCNSIRNLMISRDGGAWGSEPENESEGTICLRIADFDYTKGRFKKCKMEQLTRRQYTAAQIKKLMLKKGDILVEKSGGGEKTPVGRAVYYDGEYGDVLYANFMERLRFNCLYVNPIWMTYWLRSWYECKGSPYYINQTTGIQNINLSLMLAKEKAYYPDLVLQEKIIEFLDAKCAEIDALTADIQTQIDTLEQYKRSIITEAVTRGLNPDVEMKDSGTPWCPLIPIHWKYANPKALFTQRLDRAYPGDKQLTASQEYGVIYQDEYMELTGTKIVTVMKDFSILKHVEPNDFVISMRSFQGGLEYSERRGSISSAYVMLIPNNEYVYPPFYRWFFKSSKYINAIQSTSNLVRDGQAMRYANFAQVPLFIIPLDEQKQISEYLDEKVSKIDEILKSKNNQLEILAEYKKSLIYEYVTGKKEVPAI